MERILAKRNKQFADCSCSDCENKATDGAYVEKVKGDDHIWYIVPLCHHCNTRRDETFHVLNKNLVSLR